GYSFQNAIIIAATAILIFQPLSLFHCVSFQFSFSAMLAILLLFPIFQYYAYKKLKLKEQEKPILSFFLNTFLISLSILLFLGPLMAYYFGNFAIVSPLVNLLAIPLLAPILLFGIIALLSSIIFPPLTLIFSSIVYLLLSLLIDFSAFLNNFAFIETLQFYIPIYLLIIYYIALFIIILKFKKKTGTLSPLLSER
ncbi:MAG: ComEC/Rec2 family competence protein, partial [Candidatus Pacebacteria bacterium]|nr:ComEC/Rec2 family competence protein [Candidatus Paceibacterota bacterium]